MGSLTSTDQPSQKPVEVTSVLLAFAGSRVQCRNGIAVESPLGLTARLDSA